jgi:hypothetical protein
VQLIKFLSGPGREAQGEDRRRGQGCYQHQAWVISQRRGGAICLVFPITRSLGIPNYSLSSWEEKTETLTVHRRKARMTSNVFLSNRKQN